MLTSLAQSKGLTDSDWIRLAVRNAYEKQKPAKPAKPKRASIRSEMEVYAGREKAREMKW